MKKIIIIFVTLLVTAMFTACEEPLMLEPETAIDYDQVYIDADGVKLALDGAWSLVAGPNLYAGTSTVFSELLGADMTTRIRWTGTFIGWRDMFRKALNPNDGTIAAKWIDSYRAINIINNVLANLDNVSTDTLNVERRRVEGEARFIRGILYFQLVSFYALPWGATVGNGHIGVPLVLDPVQTYEDIVFPPRATVAQVYTLVETDLLTARRLLVPGRAGANRGLATSTNTSAFLVRVYMSQHRWADAANEATTVINAFGPNALNVTPRGAFNNPGYTSEDVFMIRQNLHSHAGSANSGIGTFFASMPGFGRGDIDVRPGHTAMFAVGDVRGAFENNPVARIINEISAMHYVGYGTRAGLLRTTKWGRFDTFVNVIRLAEMHLSRAEANFMNASALGDEPIDDLNLIRDRANAPEITDPLTINLALIQADRYRELCFEGHALHDMRRWRGQVRTPSGSPWGAGAVLPWNDNRLVFPIPQREIDVNRNLVQNPGY
ncbi:MAG TPA: RagB/SusD family nutrient uptake outer membrane protein [Bacteroidales bacterium]|nr:RagB/SusD family nutrient uptake outer membrane protein [Bacteroidales bacterium]